MRIFFFFLLFAFSAQAQVQRFWDNSSAYPTELNRAWVETHGNCDTQNKAALSIIKSRSSSLSMSERGLELSDMLDLMMTMPGFPKVNSLDLRNANFTEETLIKLNKLVPRMEGVTDLYLGGSVIADKRMFINYVLSNLAPQIQILDLSNIKLSSDDLRMLGGIIGSMKNLRVLYLGNNNFGDDGFNSLMNYSLPNLKNLQILSLQSNHLSSTSIKRFAMFAMPLMTNLQILDLKGNKIDEDTTKKLIRTSIFLPQLAVLDLDSKISKSGEAKLSSFLKCSTYSSGVFADPVQ